MKQNLFCLLFAIVASIGTMFAGSFEGFEATNSNKLGNQIYFNNLIQNKVNITLVETDADKHKYNINLTNAGTGSFQMGGVTFSYTATEAGKTAYKTYDEYIQPNGADREITIPTFNGENVKVILVEACAGILVNGVSTDFVAGDNILTASGNSIVLKSSSAKPKISAILSLADPSQQNSGRCGSNLEWHLVNGVLTISGTGNMNNYDGVNNGSNISPWSSLSIKEVLIDIGVTSIGDYAFQNCSGLTSVTIGNCVTSIGKGAFKGCSRLISITIPNSATSIGISAFSGCSSLTGELNIPNSVTSIGDYAFLNCSGLTSVNIGDSVTSIGSSAFFYCIGLTSVTIGNSVTEIGGGAFGECTGLTSVTIGNSVTSIGKGAFEDCYSLTGELNIPNSVTSIEYHAFNNCIGLTSVTIGNSVTNIEKEAFRNCSSLTSVTIPNSVTSIGKYAFQGCSSLTSVTISNSDTSFGDQAFYGCSLTSVTSYATTPPTIRQYGYVFDSTDKKVCKLYVPVGSVDLYKAAEEWKEFKYILPIAAEETETTETKVTPDATTADVVWPQVDNAYTYELVIKDKDGNVVCTLVFNAQGQLTSIAFNAPARGDAPQKTQTAGFAFTITGLESGATYNYTLTAKNEGGTVLKVEEGSFTTKAPQGIEEVESATKATKVIREGQILIQKGEKVFDLRGQKVR